MKFVVTSDAKFIKVKEATDLEIAQLKVSLQKRIKNHWFNSLVKKKVWDGYISFIDKAQRIPFGLWGSVRGICKTYDFKFEIEGLEKVVNFDFDTNDFIKWQDNFFKDSKKKPRPYQIKSAMSILKWGWSSSEIATSAGKTLIIFMIFAYLKYKKVLTRMLIIVPNISLVTQTIDDFEEYSNDRSLLRYKVQAIGDGRSKKKRKVDIVIGTFQTLRDLNNEWYEEINVLCVDEAHQAKTTSIKKVLTKCKNAHIRFGLSGTMGVTDESADAYTILGLLGPLVNKIPSNFLFKHEFATPIYIRMVKMDYMPKEIKLNMVRLKQQKAEFDGSKMYALERKIIVDNEKRFDYITKMISKVQKNSLVLFHNVKDQYGRRIADRLKKICSNKYDIFYVDGSTSGDLRHNYIRRMDDKTDTIKILVASFGTFSTGISINDLHYIFFTESFKSERIILQSIGRGMRLSANKSIMNIIDFVDDFSIDGYENYSLKHSYEREEIYLKEKFPYKVLNVSY